MICGQCASLQGKLLSRPRSRLAPSSRRQQRLPQSQISALFKRKAAAVVEPPPLPVKKGLFSFGKKEAPAPVQAPPPAKKALFSFGNKAEAASAQSKGAAGKGKKAAEQPVQRKQTFLEALDFSEVRSYEDAKLLSDAKYGVRGKDGKMTRDQYNALRRKVGGTAKSFFKETVEAKGKYVEKGYVAREKAPISEGIPGLPFLVAVVLSLFGALGYVVAQTS